MTARILPFPKIKHPEKEAPEWIDFLFGNVDLLKIFAAMPEGNEPKKTGKPKSRQKR
jgi:hypothetical protein